MPATWPQAGGIESAGWTASYGYTLLHSFLRRQVWLIPTFSLTTTLSQC